MGKDGKMVDAVYYNNADIENVEILNIKELKFEGKTVKDIKKVDIHNAVLKNEDKIYVQNNKTKMVAGLSKKHNYMQEDPFLKLSREELKAIKNFMVQYHNFPQEQDITFITMQPYLLKIFEKINNNLTCHLETLNNNPIEINIM